MVPVCVLLWCRVERVCIMIFMIIRSFWFASWPSTMVGMLPTRVRMVHVLWLRFGLDVGFCFRCANLSTTLFDVFGYVMRGVFDGMFFGVELIGSS